MALKTVLEGGEDYGLMFAIDQHSDESTLKDLMSAANLVVIGYFSKGQPMVKLENEPNSLRSDPPVIFEHGGDCY